MIKDPWFAWLRPLTTVITGIDEFVESREAVDMKVGEALADGGGGFVDGGGGGVWEGVFAGGTGELRRGGGGARGVADGGGEGGRGKRRRWLSG